MEVGSGGDLLESPGEGGDFRSACRWPRPGRYLCEGDLSMDIIHHRARNRCQGYEGLCVERHRRHHHYYYFMFTPTARYLPMYIP